MIRVGVSACLLGEPVRYDGGHKRSAVLVELLGSRFRWVPVCPEMEIGLGTPREPVRLVGDLHGPRMLGVSTARDLTRPMTEYAQRRARELAALDIAGYVLKSASPSCGQWTSSTALVALVSNNCWVKDVKTSRVISPRALG